MQSGAFVHRLTIQTRTEASDGHDGLTETWATVRARIAALVVPLSGLDLERARAVDPRASHEVSLRYWTGYVTDLDGGRARLLFHDGDVGDRTFEIVEPPREVEYRDTLAMICKEAA